MNDFMYEEVDVISFLSDFKVLKDRARFLAEDYYYSLFGKEVSKPETGNIHTTCEYETELNDNFTIRCEWDPKTPYSEIQYLWEVNIPVDILDKPVPEIKADLISIGDSKKAKLELIRKQKEELKLQKEQEYTAKKEAAERELYEILKKKYEN